MYFLASNDTDTVVPITAGAIAGIAVGFAVSLATIVIVLIIISFIIIKRQRGLRKDDIIDDVQMKKYVN